LVRNFTGRALTFETNVTGNKKFVVGALDIESFPPFDLDQLRDVSYSFMFVHFAIHSCFSFCFSKIRFELHKFIWKELDC